MKKYLQVFLLIIVLLFLTSCTIFSSDTGMRQEVSTYEEKTIDIKLPLKLKIDCDYAEIETYNWDKKQVKFEITSRLRGNKKKDQLEAILKKYSIKIQNTENTIGISGKCGSKFADYPDFCILVRIFIPKRTTDINCNISKGRLKFLDDLKCNISITAKNANLDINCLEGKLNYKAEEGCVRISAGELGNGTYIFTQKGNINIRAACMENGDYTINTQNGILKLELPEEINATFEYPGADEIIAPEKKNPARFKLRSGIGKIEIVRS